MSHYLHITDLDRDGNARHSESALRASDLESIDISLRYGNRGMAHCIMWHDPEVIPDEIAAQIIILLTEYHEMLKKDITFAMSRNPEITNEQILTIDKEYFDAT